MSRTVDARPGFFCGCETVGRVRLCGGRWKPWLGVIGRKFVNWDEIERCKFKTEAEAEAWVTERLRQLDEWSEDRKERTVTGREKL